jgi:hypothetical protein
MQTQLTELRHKKYWNGQKKRSKLSSTNIAANSKTFGTYQASHKSFISHIDQTIAFGKGQPHHPHGRKSWTPCPTGYLIGTVSARQGPFGIMEANGIKRFRCNSECESLTRRAHEIVGHTRPTVSNQPSTASRDHPRATAA